MGEFLCGTETEGGAGAPVTSVASNVDSICAWTLVVDNSEALTTDNKLFDAVKC